MRQRDIAASPYSALDRLKIINNNPALPISGLEALYEVMLFHIRSLKHIPQENLDGLINAITKLKTDIDKLKIKQEMADDADNNGEKEDNLKSILGIEGIDETNYLNSVVPMLEMTVKYENLSTKALTVVEVLKEIKRRADKKEGGENEDVEKENTEAENKEETKSLFTDKKIENNYRIQLKKINNILLAVTCASETYSKYYDKASSEVPHSSKEYERLSRQLQDDIEEINRLAADAQGHSSRFWQGVGTALVTINTVLWAASSAVALLALFLMPAGGLTTPIVIAGAGISLFCGLLMLVGGATIVFNKPRGLSYQMLLFGEKLSNKKDDVLDPQARITAEPPSTLKQIGREAFRYVFR